MAKQSPQATTEEIVDSLLQEAVTERASDIHIDANSDGTVRIRFRIDNILHDRQFEQLFDVDKMLSRIKVLSGLDITVHDIPQEGHFIFYRQDEKSVDRPIDVRVSIFPTIYGEAVVMRLLNRDQGLLELSQLGFAPDVLPVVNELVKMSHGMVLSTGPVNSGKTTTLYSILKQINATAKNIITLEDPVEYHMPRIRQSQISPAREYTFKTGLRSILRQDPDVIMVGEIRDPDTAEIAIRASLTGRLVLSTLHTSTAVSTIARMIDMGVERWLVAYSLNGVITQRLVGVVCEYCKVEYTPTAEALSLLNVTVEQTDNFLKGQGCARCFNTGFRGRMGIFEVLQLDDEMRDMILENASSSDLEAKALEKGMRTLMQDGVAKARQGLTTLEEVMRVVR